MNADGFVDFDPYGWHAADERWRREAPQRTVLRDGEGNLYEWDGEWFHQRCQGGGGSYSTRSIFGPVTFYEVAKDQSISQLRKSADA